MNASSEKSRRRAVQKALASSALEGLVPTTAYLNLLDRYVAGEITIDQVRATSIASEEFENPSVLP